MRLPMFALFLSLAACQGAGGQGPASPAPGTSACRQDALAAFVGQRASEATGAAMLKASGARTLRWGVPGMAMTMDYRDDRLTVSYDGNMAITAARCG